VRLAFVLGTRPEVIKLAPVIRAAEHSEHEPVVISTGQHREMLDQMLQQFGVVPHYELRVMRPRQELPQLTGELLAGITDAIQLSRPDVVLVQGDTSSAFSGALAGFFEKVPVAHVEAGLRTRDLMDPFPEEANRRLIAPLAELHFCPTEKAQGNLIREGVDPDRISIVGNTVIDSLLWARRKLELTQPSGDRSPARRLLVTLHRRENQGAPMQSIVDAISSLAEFESVEVLFPVHKSPTVREIVYPALASVTNVRLTEPLDYFDFVRALDWCDLVLTDSGGVQEEAPTFGKPVLVARDTTERPEGVEAGVAKLVGSSPTRICDSVVTLLANPDAYNAMATACNPFGDGEAAQRIVERIETHHAAEPEAELETALA